jgi:hypothetical protein
MSHPYRRCTRSPGSYVSLINDLFVILFNIVVLMLHCLSLVLSLWGADSPNGRPQSIENMTLADANEAIGSGMAFRTDTKQFRHQGAQAITFQPMTRYIVKYILPLAIFNNVVLLKTFYVGVP